MKEVKAQEPRNQATLREVIILLNTSLTISRFYRARSNRRHITRRAYIELCAPYNIEPRQNNAEAARLDEGYATRMRIHLQGGTARGVARRLSKSIECCR
jgi:hypothetical protein